MKPDLEKESLHSWNDYWSRSPKIKSYWAYDLLAAFYRKNIIRPSLTKYVKKYFEAGQVVLHAGCGSGQVDENISNYIHIKALDLSPQALKIYEHFNPRVKDLILGSIFEIPLDDESIDGIYNLGVMEHFYLEDIKKILNEFHRVLKPSGKAILFWPPKQGLSVNFLKFVHLALKGFTKKQISLHPPEVTHIESRQQASLILHNSGFELVEYSFGISDLFTHAIIVAIKR